MIKIINVSDEKTPNIGENDYELMINDKLICAFKHARSIEGLAACLRDAADAVEANKENQLISILEKINKGESYV